MSLDSVRSLGTGTHTNKEAQQERLRDDLRHRGRVIVEHVWPEIDGGRFPIKRTVGEHVTVSADVFADGHDLLAGVVKFRHVPGPKGPGLPDRARPR